MTQVKGQPKQKIQRDVDGIPFFMFSICILRLRDKCNASSSIFSKTS
jgi:hypothetical protein